MTSIGIDLGTTNSVLSYIENGVPVSLSVDGSTIFPSVVLFDDDRVVAGREAKNLELLHPGRTVRSAKRTMGTDHKYKIGNREISSEEVSAEVLKALRSAAEKHLGKPVTDVVITVPAYFDEAQRRATLRSGELAGLNVLRLLNEPTSASLCYERARTETPETDEPELVMIYDLGGGTFDVSVLEVFGGVREVRATNGNTQLGGDDFDDKLVAHFVDHIKATHAVDPRGDARAMVQLRRLAEQTKIALSTDTRTTVSEEFLMSASGRAVHLQLDVTRREFEALVRPMFEATIALARRALEDANVAPEALARICLVGGSTRVPLARTLLREAFDAPIHEELDVDLAVGLGAAVQAAMLEGETVGKVLVDVAAHSLGVQTLSPFDDDGDADHFAPVLGRNTVLPAVRAEEFYTVADNQKHVEVCVYQGESSIASENTLVGNFRYDLAPAPAGSACRVEFAYDLDGMVRVTVSQAGNAGVAKTVVLSVADAGKAAQRAATAVERRALSVIETLEPRAAEQLRALLDGLKAASDDKRPEIEDAILDFLVLHEPEGDEDLDAEGV
jgi:molecular chaperone DnaK